MDPDDVKATLAKIEKNRLMKDLQQNGMVSIAYRQMLDGKHRYMNMQVVQPRNDSHHIVIGVFNNDAQVRREKSLQAQNRTFNDISLALAQQYEVIYHVNIRTNEYSEYSASEKYAKLKVGIRRRVNIGRDCMYCDGDGAMLIGVGAPVFFVFGGYSLQLGFLV